MAEKSIVKKRKCGGFSRRLTSFFFLKKKRIVQLLFGEDRLWYNTYEGKARDVTDLVTN